MNLTDVAAMRLVSQQVPGIKFNTVKGLVGFMGAMQAQDYAMAKWAVGVRLPGSTNQLVEKAIDRGEIIRTHVMRPTWHLISSDDIYWMLQLTAPRIRSAAAARHKQLELTEAAVFKSNQLIGRALERGRHLTRAELLTEFKKAGITVDDNRSSHLLICAELDGIVCSGATKGNQTTYALLEERVPRKQALTREEALAKLAGIYFTSHGPATVQDFTWWSGLSAPDARHALELVRSGFISASVGSVTYWFTQALVWPPENKASVHLLPAFDEFIISYKDRAASLLAEHQHKVLSDNGIFWPVVVINGEVEGLWKRVIKKDQVIIKTELFKPQKPALKSLLKKAAAKFADFLEKKVELVYG